MANTVTCLHCGASFRTATSSFRSSPGPFCSAGCGIAGRIPVDKDGQYPVNAALLSGLAIGLLYFNEILFALLARTATAVQPARSVTSEHFLWFSAGLGGLVWLGVVVVNLRLNLLRKPDIAVIVPILAAIGVACRHFPPAPIEIIGGNAILLAWSTRGLIKKRFTRKNTVLI